MRRLGATRKVVVAVMAAVFAVLASAMPAAAGTKAGDAETAVRTIVFPVVNLQRYRDNFQECRDSCARLHEGIDVFGPRHSPLLATRDATVVRVVTNSVDGGIYGNNVLLRDDDGWTYLYSHLNNDRPGTDDGSNPPGHVVGPGIAPGARVTAGQVVGYVGDSGNAERSVPHLHFEIHNPAGEFINPYRSLVTARRLSGPLDQRAVPAADRAYLRALGVHFLAGPILDVQRAVAYDHLRWGNRAAVVAELPRSGAWLRTEITGHYRRILRREPDPPGLAHWIWSVALGLPLVSVQASLHASDEYRRRAGSDAGWIDALYRDLTGRPADDAGRRYWSGLLAAGHRPLDIAYAFVQAVESRGVRVDRLYRRLLDRPADPPGRRYWADVLGNRDDLTLASFLAASDEYYGRAPRV